MDKVKIKNIKTGIIKEVPKAIASDFLGTNEWEMVVEEKTKFIYTKKVEE